VASSLPYISPEQTVRQVAGAFPACADLLGRWPGARRAGRWSLQQLGPLARQAGLDEQALLGELAGAAGVELGPHREHRDGMRGRRRGQSPLPLIFTALAVGISFGTAFGVEILWRIAMAGRYEAVSSASIHVHGMAQLWGWMTLFIFAVAMHLLRQNTTRPAPRWMEWLAGGFVLSGILAYFVGLCEPARDLLPGIDIAGSALLLVAAILFGGSVAWSLSGSAKGQQRHGLIFLVAWLWIWAATDLWLRVHYANVSVLPDWARSLLIVLPVLGLATNAIYGFGIRLIPGLLNIGRLRRGWFGPALLMHNAGLCLFLIPRRRLQSVGAVLMLAGAAFYLVGMDGLRSKPSRPIYGIDARGHILIRVAFFWLIGGLCMILLQQFHPQWPHAYSGAWRHALTVGFISTMIMGVGFRIIPIFIKQPLASTQLMLISAALIIMGNASRVTLELLTIGGWGWSFRLMGFTGILELAALVLFAMNIGVTAGNRRRGYSGAAALTPDTRVQEAVNARPEIQDRFGELGITMFDAAPFIAPSMTLGALALASGMTPRQLVDVLEEPPHEGAHGPHRNLTAEAVDRSALNRLARAHQREVTDAR
jgi:uncharacterized protein involved in response to NO